MRFALSVPPWCDVVVDRHSARDRLYVINFEPARPFLLGSVEAFGAQMAYNLADAYRPAAAQEARGR